MTIKDLFARLRLVVVSGLALVALAACAGSQTPAPPTTNPSVTPITGSEAEELLKIKSSDGVAPCGVFNVNGHGSKDVPLASFPDCAADFYSVLCLNEQAQWIATYVKEFGISPDGKVAHFTSAQDGICGLFPQP